MHPILRRPKRLLLYLLAWVPPASLFATLLHFGLPTSGGAAYAFAQPLFFLYGLVCLSAWWVCRARPLTEGALAAAVAAQLRAALQSSLAWALTAALWGLALARFFRLGPDTAGLVREALAVFVVGIPLYLASAVMHYLWITLEESHEAAELALEAQVAAREAELRAVRAQLNPHFLFNSLNSINALVGQDPEGARRMCEGLGDFLRRTLALGAREKVTLGDELALVDRYLAIEQVRFGDRLRVTRAIDPQALACTLPPLLLQPLVENAIKHGVAGRLEGGTVALRAERRADRLVLALENPVDADGAGAGSAAAAGEGFGLDIVRRRLLAHGDGGASLTVTPGPGTFRVTLDLPAVTAHGAPARG